MSTRTTPDPLQIPTDVQLKIGIVRSTFHDGITQELLNEAVRCLDEHHIPYDVITVKGAFELAYALEQLAQTKQYQALVALGCLVKGESIHFEVVAQATAQGIMNAISKHNIPIGFGVITAMDLNQAKERTWIGYDATHAAVDSYLQTTRFRSN